MNEIGLAIFQTLLLVLIAPLVSGTSRVLRAKMHTRRGPSILQDYYDIIKLFKRQDVWQEDSGHVFRTMPVIYLATMMLLAMGMPMITRFCPIPALGNIITVIYLFVLPRFLLSLASVDSTASYPSVGGVRELVMGVLVEPSMMLSLIVAAIAAGTTDIGGIGTSVSSGGVSSYVAIIVAAVAFAIACYIELGKLPYDMAEAEQELQEGPLAEYSGPSLAMLKLSLSMKQVLMVSWFLAVFLPAGSATAMTAGALALGLLFWFLKMAAAFLVCALIENLVVRARFKAVGKQTWMVFGLSMLAFVFLAIGV